MMGHGKGKERKRKRAFARVKKLTAEASRPPQYKDPMGIYQEYITQKTSPGKLDQLRKEQLRRIEQALSCRVITYAARIAPLPPEYRVDLIYEDFLPFVDLLGDLSGDRIAVILETPGGSGETAREIVDILHERFAHVAFIIPGMAKSAGTIMALGGHQIYMGPFSSLGPIDAQLSHDGKAFSADEFVKGFQKIKAEADASGKLSLAYIPALQRISPGELEHAENALNFAKDAVTEWMAKYKFANWETRSSTGEKVTTEFKTQRAREIADQLADQSTWRSHGRSLRISDLRQLRMEIDDYSSEPDLNDAIARYYALLRITFDYGIAYKVIETATATVARLMAHVGLKAPVAQVDPSKPIIIGGDCAACGTKFERQLDFLPGAALKPGAKQFPDSGQFHCEQCGNPIDLRDMRANLERQMGRPALNPQPKRS